MPEVVVTERIEGPSLDQLVADFNGVIDPSLWQRHDQFVESVTGARALIVRNQSRVTREIIEAAPRLEIIARAGAGLDNVDVAAASDAGIVVSYAAGANSLSVAELTIGLLLSLARKIPAAHAETIAGHWDRQRFTGSELNGKTLGIVGLGRIGQLVAERARALGMRLIAHDLFVDPDSEVVARLGTRIVTLDELLQESDFVTCHVPLTEETRGAFDFPRFEKMKPTAMFVNTSRGEVIDEDGLARALTENRIAGAALDVRAEEPPAVGLFEDLPNVILTPHIAAFTHEAQSRVVDVICRDVRAVLNGEAATGFVNFPLPRK